MTSLGPDSLTWRFFGDNRTLLSGPRGGVLQLMLPALGQGVLDHSVFFEDTFGRLKRSAGPILNTVYGGNTGPKVRDYHREIKGEMPDGSRYHALDPETYFYAHATFFDHMLYTVETFIRPLSEDEKHQLYDEAKTWYRLYGVSDRAMPEDWPSFQIYWKRMLSEGIEAHKSARYSVGYVKKGLPRPRRLPAAVWRPVNTIARFLTIGGLPPEARTLLDLPWSSSDERRYQRFAATVRRAAPLWDALPSAVRYQPHAHRAIKRARRAFAR